MKKFLCKLLGHNWHEHPLTQQVGSVPFCICSRCGKTGWLL